MRAGKRVGLVVAASMAVGFIVGGWTAAPALKKYDCSRTNSSILSIFAREVFDRFNRFSVGPTRVTEISKQAILADKCAVPTAQSDPVITVLDDDGTEQPHEVQVAPAIDLALSRLLYEVQQVFSSSSSSPSSASCNPKETDLVLGTTALHLAEGLGSRDLVEYLVSIGANAELYESARRQPRDMVYSDLKTSTKMAAPARLSEGTEPGDRCKIPEVMIPLFLGVATENTEQKAEQTPAANDWRVSVSAVLSVVSSIVCEGVPVTTCSVVPFLLDETTTALPAAAPAEATSGKRYALSRGFGLQRAPRLW